MQICRTDGCETGYFENYLVRGDCVITSRTFHISDVLSVTTGRLASNRGIDGIYDILTFMTGDNLFTNQLPRARDECSPYLLRQYPALKDIDIERFDLLLNESKASNGLIAPEQAIEYWIVEECERLELPEMLDVEPIPRDDHDVRDPIEELESMLGKDRVIGVRLDDGRDK